jgi:hypothetical protein
MHRIFDCHAQVEVRAAHESYEEDEPYNIDIDWDSVRAVPVPMAMSKAEGKMAFAVGEDRGGAAPPRWVPWARGAYDPAVHGCSSALCKRV